MRNYDDIIDMPHHVSAARKHMKISDRAAQFAPFAALTGFSYVIDETARVTSERPVLTDDVLEMMDRCMGQMENMPDTWVKIEYFRDDEWKDGGEFLKARGRIKRIKRDEGCIEMEDGTVIRMADITGIDIHEDDT